MQVTAFGSLLLGLGLLTLNPAVPLLVGAAVVLAVSVGATMTRDRG